MISGIRIVLIPLGASYYSSVSVGPGIDLLAQLSLSHLSFQESHQVVLGEGACRDVSSRIGQVRCPLGGVARLDVFLVVAELVVKVGELGLI